MNPTKIRIVIVDDHQQVRQTWKLLLEQEIRFDIIAECSNADEAVIAAQNLLPDIILMDINMQPIDGFEATKKIVAAVPSIKIIGISIHNQPLFARNMIRMGAKGYVTKNSSKQEMTTAIISVFNGGQYVCEEVKNKMRDSQGDQHSQG